MFTAVIQCPHCAVPVAPKSDGACPACGKNIDESRAAAARASEDDITATLPRIAAHSLPKPDRRIERLLEDEVDFIDRRVPAIANLSTGQLPDHELARRIETELIPKFDLVIGELDGLPEKDRYCRDAFVHARRESWRHLITSIRGGGPDKVKQHKAMWNESMDRLSAALNEQQAGGCTAPPHAVVRFERSLAVYTPRLVATPAIIALNVLVFLAMAASGVEILDPDARSLFDWGGNYAPSTMNGQWWRLVTAMFIHGGFLHLAFNTWALWDLGRLVERLVGTWGFLVLYFASGVAGSLASVYFHPDVVCIGASGAVFGVGGALLGLLARNPEAFPPDVLSHLRNSMLAFLGYNVVYGLQSTNVDMAAHVGGFVAGLAGGLLLAQPLSDVTVAQRKWRNAALLAAALLVLPTVAQTLPVPADVDGELRAMADAEEKIFARLDQLASQPDISDKDYEQLLKTEILAPWRELRGRIARLDAEVNDDGGLLQRVGEYMSKRDESLQMFVDAIDEQSDEKFIRAEELKEEADKLAENLGKQ